MRILLTCILFFLVLGGLVFRIFQFFQTVPNYRNGEVFISTATLHEDPEVTNQGQKFAIHDRYNQRIYIRTASFPQYANGQVLRIAGNIQRKEFEDKRIVYSMHYPQIIVVLQDENPVFALAREIKDHTKQVYERTLPAISAGLLMGIVFGSKEHYPEDFSLSLQSTGVMHVIAASGMNVTFVASALMYCLGYIFRRQTAMLFAIGGIVFYVFIVGFQPSIIRAAIMAMIVFSARILGRQSLAGYAVVVTAVCMLWWQPAYLIDVGFQLSFLATLGIMYLKPFLPIPENTYTESVTTTLSAELATVPILISVFGQVGIFSLLVNAIVLWTIPLLMTLGSLAVVFSFIFAPIAQLVLLLTLPFLLYFEMVVRIFGSFGSLHMPLLPWEFGAAYYLILLACVYGYSQRTKERMKVYENH